MDVLCEEEGVLVMSSGHLSTEHFISKILGSEMLPTPSIYKNDIKIYPWQIDTKYYTAQINLFAAENLVELRDQFSEKIEAAVFYFDYHEPSSFKNILSWNASLTSIKPEVKLLLCDNCNDKSISELQKKDILNWCIENEYELIELNPSVESDEEDDDIIQDVKGYNRVIQALQSHMWPNMIMKGDKESNEVSNAKDISQVPPPSSSEESKKSKASKTVKVGDDELLLEDQWLQNVLGQDDPGGESFEALFQKFASMKDKASSLHGEERKKYAEKVAIAFWRAMGGEEDEIEGLDD